MTSNTGYVAEAEADEALLYFAIVLWYLVLYFGIDPEAEADDVLLVCAV